MSGGFSYVSTPFAFGMEIAEAEEESDAQVYSTSETNLDQKLIMLKHELPWISSVLNGNETISLLSGKYIRIYTAEFAVQNNIQITNIFCVIKVHTSIITRRVYLKHIFSIFTNFELTNLLYFKLLDQVERVH